MEKNITRMIAPAHHFAEWLQSLLRFRAELFIMNAIWQEAQKFFASTSIHGLPYISNSQSRPTRIIWTIFALSALCGASYFLYETVDGFDEKYVSTTIDTRSIPIPSSDIQPRRLQLQKFMWYMPSFLGLYLLWIINSLIMWKIF